MSSVAPPPANGTAATPFAAALVHHVAALHARQNVVVSPLLLEAALALLYLGSDGVTADELTRALQLKRFGSNAKMAAYFADVVGAFAGAADTQILPLQTLLLADDGALSEEFRKIALKYFRTGAERAPLGDRAALLQHINEALQRTSLGPLTPDVAPTSASPRALLLCAAHFRSKWFLPFSAYRSGLYEFHLSPEERRPVPMLFDDDLFVKFAEFKELDARAIELPYEHEEELAMLVVLPNRRDGLAELERRLCDVDLLELDERLQMESVQVLLPKFRIDFELGLRETLAKLGVSTMFGAEANFKNLLKENSTERLPIDDVLHKVCIEVNESGSEPATVAVAPKPIVLSNSLDSRQRFFRADHPFYFAVRSRDVVYFAGHVTTF